MKSKVPDMNIKTLNVFVFSKHAYQTNDNGYPPFITYSSNVSHPRFLF